MRFLISDDESSAPARQRLVNETNTLTATRPAGTRFLVKAGKNYRVVSADEIISVQSAANYIVLRTADGRHILRRTLRQFEAELCPRRFFRTSRSTIANLKAVREVRTNDNGTHTVVLSDGSDLPLTVHLREFESRLRDLG